jgi:hypothetical protein
VLKKVVNCSTVNVFSGDAPLHPIFGGKLPAPLEDQNAAKDSAEKAESFLHIRARRADKARWVKAAQRAGKELSDWVTELLNSNS